jgi:uncharacterized LabA/DUF88 family protein
MNYKSQQLTAICSRKTRGNRIMYTHKHLDFIDKETKDSLRVSQAQEDLDMIDATEKFNTLNNLNRGRIAIFIDGANLFYSALNLGIEINYTKLLRRLTAGAKFLRAFFYTGIDSTNEKQQNFLLWMRRNGYRVIAKELVQFPDGSRKANLDVEMAVDMMTLVNSYDTAILVSGDGDLAYAVNALSYLGVRIEVVSLRSMTSDSLINVADSYIDLNTIKEEIQKTPLSSCTPEENLQNSLS